MLDNLYFGKDDAETDMARGGLLAKGFLQTQAYEAAKKGRSLSFSGVGAQERARYVYIWSGSYVWQTLQPRFNH